MYLSVGMKLIHTIMPRLQPSMICHGPSMCCMTIKFVENPARKEEYRWIGLYDLVVHILLNANEVVWKVKICM